MFAIPEDLPLDLAPLAWMIGRWQGWGMLATPQGEEDRPLLQDVHAEVVGERLRMVTSLYYSTGTPDPMWDAGEGLDGLERGEIVGQETTYWGVLPAPEVSISFGEEEAEISRELQVTGADMQGLAYLWVGMSMGPRIRLVSDVVAREEGAPEVGKMARMYGLVGGEMFWTADNTVGDEDPVVLLSGRLQRVNE